MTKKQLLQKLSDEFNGVKIVKLKDITEKTTIIAKVRVREKRTFTNYDEISLNNIDEYGEVFIPDDTKQQEAANTVAIEAQALRYGDLVLNQRTAKMKVGFIGKHDKYKRVIVGNNSMIKIRFKYNDIDTARFVQLYLQLPYVLEYLNALPICTQASKSSRRIINSEQIRELPIPEYIESKQLISLSEVLYPKMELISLAKKMRDNAQAFIEKYEKMRTEAIDVNFKDSFDEKSIDKNYEDIGMFMELEKFYSKIY